MPPLTEHDPEINLTVYVREMNINDPFHERLLDEMSHILHENMFLHDLWEKPPKLLGYLDIGNWNDEGALEEISIDCYNEVIIMRIYDLKKRVDRHENIDNLIYRWITNFLIHRQR